MEPGTLTFTVVIEPDEGSFQASVPALPEITTFGDTIEEARTNAIEAIELFVGFLAERGELAGALERGAARVTSVTTAAPPEAGPEPPAGSAA